MPWTVAQRNRLVAEKETLERFFPGRVTWIDPAGDTKVEIMLNTNNGNNYCLRIYLKSDGNSDFPNSMPDMVVRSSPEPMPRWGVDGNKHTVGYRDDFLKIGHYRPSRWTDRSTLYEVVMKGRIWLEAYEAHLKTGECLSKFLGDMKE